MNMIKGAKQATIPPTDRQRTATDLYTFREDPSPFLHQFLMYLSDTRKVVF
jgi:hypothetical protein